KKILLVDVESNETQELKKFLEHHGYNVHIVSDYRSSVSAVQNWKPDLVILNIFIRSFSPLNLIEDIRKNPFTENQKMLILSRIQKITAVTGPSPEVKGYLSKPIDFEHLKELLVKTAGAAGKDFQIPVLVADDDLEFCDLIKMFLESNYYRPVIVTDAQKILQKIKEEKPSLILLDLMMPGKDGFQVLDELQDEIETSKIPIIVLSALRLESYQERGAMTGLPEIISKEIPKELLLNIIEKEIAGPDQPSAALAIQKPKVLIADDQTELLYLMKETLEEAGFEVVVAHDGAEALKAVFDTNPDIAVLDYNMPLKDGLAVAEEMKENPLFAHIPIIIVTAFGEKKSKLRGLSMGIDDYLTKPVDTDELIARIKMILKRNKMVLDTNPLSKLPGNPSIQARIEREISKNVSFAVLYIDLNNFKAYNDSYGFEAGDRIIRATANLLVKLTIQNEKTGDFIGHIGGDDFIVITSFDKAEDLCKRIINGFNEIAPSFYNKDDRERGHIMSTDRMGNIKKFPFLSISIGVVHNTIRRLISFAQVSNIGTELKKYAKGSFGSSYVIDRRKD
ncbi:MAG: response regulator, partial [Elusimicrobia bacterium]|nr:response regulator [Elusimicrobiota bacterium]